MSETASKIMLDNEIVISESQAKILEIKEKNTTLLRQYFRKNCVVDGVDIYNDSFIEKIFLTNNSRKILLRSVTESAKKYFLLDSGSLWWDDIKLDIFSPLSDESKIIEDLICLGFPSHSFESDTDWGRGRFEYLKYDIFKRFIIDGGSSCRSYYVHGFIGSGKSTLMSSIAKRLYIYLDIKPRYTTLTSLARLFTASVCYENKSEQYKAKEQLELLQNSLILFVDNVSFSQLTDRQLEYAVEFFYNRYSRRLPVFIASNNDISKQYSNPFLAQLTSWMRDSNYFSSPIHFDWSDRRE